MVTTFSRELVAVIGTLGDEHVTRQANELGVLVSEMDQAISRSLKSSFTKRIHASEDRRKLYLVAIKADLVSSVKQPFLSADKSLAAEDILVGFRKIFGTLRVAGAKVSSADVIAFLQLVEGDAAVGVAGIAPIVSLLHEEQLALDTLYKEKVEIESSMEKVRRTRDIRSDIEMRIRGLLSYISINMKDLPQSYLGMYNAVDFLVADFNSRIKKTDTSVEELAEGEALEEAA